jgi:ATP-dependent 26S proteasome regulatory subunit
MYGPPGGGKTTAISKVCKRYLADNKTACIIWNTDKFESYEVKDLISTLAYKDLDRLILIAEDLGGVEVEGRDRASDSSLLSILDNKEKTFNIPTLILSTTNYPENFMENLTNRPERFDDKIEVKYPDASSRVELLKFFLKSETLETNIETFIKSTKCDKFTPAHIKQSVIRMATKKKTMLDALTSVYNDIERYNKGFKDKRGMGL